MAKVYVFLANGFEDIEALGTIDILRRGGVTVKTVSITDSENVETAHGVTVKADMTFADADLADADMLVLPGGLPGATYLGQHEGLLCALKAQHAAGRRIAAICAAPMVLGSIGLLDGKRATCYPGCETNLGNAVYTHELVTTDGNITTGEGPAATFPFTYELVSLLAGNDTAARLRDGMMFTHLMENR